MSFQRQPTPTIYHPHPLRSHCSAEDLLASGSQGSTPTHSPTISVTSLNDARRCIRPITSHSRTTSSNGITALPSLSGKTLAASERLGDDPGTGNRVEAIPVRPPLRPTISFSSEVSKYSYYSVVSPVLEQKSMRVAMEEELQDEKSRSRRRNWTFYGAFVVLSLLNFVCDFSSTALASVLPTISQDLDLTALQTFWIPGSLLLAATISQPLFMRLSSALGCKALLLFGLVLFTAGSIIAALFKSATLLIAGRAIEGVGMGAMGVLTQLTLDQISQSRDGHPAHYRRTYHRAASHLFWLGIAAGPIVGGACVQTIGRRNIFWIQALFSILGLLTLPFLLKLPWIESESVSRRLLRTDVLGWILLSGTIIAIALAVSWGGTRHSWTSRSVLVPLILGVLGLPLWCFYNLYRIESILPVSIFRNASVSVSCFGALVQGALLTAIIYFMPVFLQLQGLNQLLSALSLAPWTFSVVVFGLLSGALQSLTGYRWASWTAWALATTGLGLMIMFDEKSSVTFAVPVGLIGGIALGILQPSLSTAIESAASNDDETIHAGPLHLWFTTLGRTFGILGSGSIFLNNLPLHLVKDAFTLDTDQMSSYIPALRPIWITATALTGLAFFLSFWFLEDHTPPPPKGEAAELE